MATEKPRDAAQPAFLVDPAALRIMLVDANASSRSKLAESLRKCSYQVTACETSQEAIQILKAQKRPEGGSGYDLLLKDHCPVAGANACRLLRKVPAESVLQGIPIIVASSTEDRDVMVNCLQLGAADYMMKPLRLTELRNLWARVYWWRRASYLQELSPITIPLPQPSVHSDISADSLETKCGGNMAKHGINQEKSGEGSAPNETRVGQSMENGNKDPGSKNASKEGNVGWSRNQAKPGSAQGNSGEAVGNSASKPCQGSTHPSTADGATGRRPEDKRPSDASLVSKPEQSSMAVTALQATPFGHAAMAGTESGSRRSERDGSQWQLPSGPSGFKTYVAKDSRKRPSSCLKAEPASKYSSGRTHSKEPPAEKMRRTASWMPNGATEAAASGMKEPGFGQPPAQDTMSGGAACNNLPAGCLPEGKPQSSLGPDSCNMLQQAAQVGFNPYFPFGVMPNPFTMPYLWGQMGSQPHESELAQFFAQLAQQVQSNAASQGAMLNKGEQQQQQQQAMNLQLMLQHSMLVQQYAMPPNPYACFQNYSASGQAGQNQPQATSQAAAAPIVPQSRLEAQPSVTQPPAQKQAGPAAGPGDGSGFKLGTKRNQIAEQSNPSSGKRTEAGTAAATGTTLGTAGTGNATGATSHATAQVGLDGCLVEPSQQERRAQALHKYKQKRKNLCFTKKIRYESRKQLAQARPRVKGQFVRVRSDGVSELVNTLAETEKESGGLASNAGVLTSTVERNVVDDKPGDPQGTPDTKDLSEDDETEEDEPFEDDIDSVSPALAADCQPAQKGADNKASQASEVPPEVKPVNNFTAPPQSCTV